jgi:HK97 family phage prohead protease
MENYHFSGWATKNNLQCSDNRIIMKDAFKHNDGATVPLVWMHQHNEPFNVLGHALLKNMDEGVYAYCTFNDSESGKQAKELVEHGDVSALSIYANQLKQQGNNVMHGNIREVSLVLAGANPGAFIDSIICHGDESDEEAVIYTGEDITLAHSEEETTAEEETLEHADKKEETKKEEEPEMADEKKTEAQPEADAKEKTYKDVWEGILKKTTEEEQNVLYAMLAEAMDASDDSDDGDDENEEVKHSDETEIETETENETENEEVKHSDEIEGGNEIMHKNVFETETQEMNVLSHADEKEILDMARSCGSFKTALKSFADTHGEALAHSFDAENMGKLFPDAKDVYPGAPELIERDNSWVGAVLNKAHKSPAARIRTRHADATAAEARARGYLRNKNEGKKVLSSGLKAITRTTDPQTVVYRDNLHRDDVLDLDFDMIAYQKVIMKHGLEEEVARAALIGDGREDGAADKIDPEKIRPVWGDAPEYTIQALVDTASMKNTLQGTNTAANFGEEFIFTEAVIAAVQDARVQYKGKGTPDWFCAPSTLNKMLRTRDMNGRRIYDSAADLAKVLNVGAIHTVEQMEGQERTDLETSKKFKLHGLVVNMSNYTFGSAKGGEITGFEQFDIDFNLLKFLQEARLSGALDHLYSAIAVEEDVTAAG